MPLTSDVLAVPSVDALTAMIVRLVVAAAAGALLGAERESVGKAAGLRTHMLVALGAALFVVVVIAHGQDGDVGRAIQGVAAGIGFIGAGTILKEAQTQRVTGLTTAASIWMTAAVGVSAGAGSVWLSIVATLVAWIILNIFPKLERRGPPGAS